jgi:O-antigen ligase
MNRALIMSGLAGLGTLTILVGIYAERSHPGAVLAALLLFGAGSVVVPACMGKPWALKICLFTLIVVGFMSFRSRDSTDLSVDSSIIYRLAVWSAVFVIGLANLPASVRYFQNVPYLGLAAYLFLAAGSAIYSLTPTYTLGCAYSYFCMLVFMPAVVARLGIKESLRVAMLAVGTHVLIAVILWFVAPDIVIWRNWAGSEARLRGFMGHPTKMAEMAALFLLSALVMWRQQWLTTRAFAFVGLLGAFALFLTQTRSSIAAVALALFSTGRFRPASMAALTAVVLGGMIAVQAIPEALDAIARQASRGEDVEGTLTLTGRTHIWQESLRMFAERPLFGYGFAATRVLFANEFVVKGGSEGEAPPHAHNIVIQSLVTTGIIGTLLLLMPLVIPVIHSLRHRDGVANPLTWYVAIVGLAGLGPIGAAPQPLTLFWMLSLLMIQSTVPSTIENTLGEGRIPGVVRMGRYPGP